MILKPGCALEALCELQPVLAPLGLQSFPFVKWGKGAGLWALLDVTSLILSTKSDGLCEPMLDTGGKDSRD